jgi:hypothetical protein
VITRVYVDRHVIRANKSESCDLPPLSIRRGGRVTKARAVEIHGPSRVVYAPEKPLPCGATVWVETIAEVTAT